VVLPSERAFPAWAREQDRKADSAVLSAADRFERFGDATAKVRTPGRSAEELPELENKAHPRKRRLSKGLLLETSLFCALPSPPQIGKHLAR
jgi:hypothetical protein